MLEVIGTFNKTCIRTTSEVAGYVGGCRNFYKTCIGTTSEVVGTMYVHVGSCRNFYQSPVGPVVLSVVATCGFGLVAFE